MSLPALLLAASVSFHVPASESAVAPAVRAATEAGTKRVEAWFGRPFARPFAVTVLPSRAALDALFAERWKAPRSACWMVAAGVGDGLFLLSPRAWKAEACEHASTEAHIAEIVAHELVHVFHGQQAPSPEFDGMDDVAWFAEGLATLVSGQLAGAHAGDAAAALAPGKGPARLAEAWSGRWKYGVAGSLVAFVEKAHGRAAVEKLLHVRTNAEAMAMLGTTEEAFLAAWRKDVEGAGAR